MSKLLVLFCFFYTIPNDTSVYISLLNIEENPKIQLVSTNLSNSMDSCLSIPHSYKTAITISTNHIFKTNCKEDILVNRYNLFPYTLTIIKLSHNHDLLDEYVRIGGEREIYVNGLKAGSYNFPPCKVIKHRGYQLHSDDIPENRRASDQSLCMSKDPIDYQLRAFSLPEVQITPREKYLITFRYLIPPLLDKNSDCLFQINQYQDTKNNWRVLDNKVYKLNYNPKKIYYQKFRVVIESQQVTSIRCQFKIDSKGEDDQFLDAFFVKDFQIQLLNHKEENP